MLGHGALGEFALGETESTGTTIRPSSIASAEAWGTHTVTADAYVILPASIPSGEAWGTPTVGENSIYPDSIPSGEAWGTASLILVISPGSIASAEAWGSPSVYELIVYEPVSIGSGGSSVFKRRADYTDPA
jgi:hypothetical protein